MAAIPISNRVNNASLCLHKLDCFSQLDVTLGVLEASTLEKFAISCGIILVMLIGLPGNIVVVAMVTMNRKLHRPQYVFIASLSVVDFTVIMVAFGPALIALQHHTWPVGDSTCQFLGISIDTLAVSSLYHMTIIAFNRYVCIVHPMKVKDIYDKAGSACMIALSWLCAFAVSTPPLFGWGDIEFQAKALACTYIWSSSVSYSVFFSIIGITIAESSCVYCYTMILLKVHSSKRRVQQLSATHVANHKGEIKLALFLLLVFLVFNICWAPFIVLNIFVDTEHKLHRVYHLTAAAFLVANSAVNPILYFFHNDVFRQKLAKLVRPCSRREAIPSKTSHKTQTQS